MEKIQRNKLNGNSTERLSLTILRSLVFALEALSMKKTRPSTVFLVLVLIVGASNIILKMPSLVAHFQYNMNSPLSRSHAPQH